VLSEVLDSFGLMHQALRPLIRPLAMRFPVFHGGIGPLDTKGRAERVAKDEAIDIAGVRIAAGDWVMGDIDADAVWGPHIHVEPRTVDVHIRRPRESISASGELDIVRTVRAAGYQLDTEPV
jgi:hypothetical protein